MKTWAGRRLDELRVAMMFLTRLPMGRVARQVPMADTVWAWPLAGLVVGVVFALAQTAAELAGLAPDLGIALGLGAALLATGGLHEDGLADLADGVGGGGDPARRLAIMKDSRLGSYGAMALIFAFLLGFLGWREIAAAALLAPALGALSRMGLPLCAWITPAARPKGLAQMLRQGLGAAQVMGALLCGWLMAALLLGPLTASLLAAVCLGVQLLMCLWARRRLGGLNGDVLGAAQVLGALAALLVAGGA